MAFPGGPSRSFRSPLALLRYGQLVLRGEGEAPEELALRDRWLALAVIAWLIVFAIGVQVST